MLPERALSENIERMSIDTPGTIDVLGKTFESADGIKSSESSTLTQTLDAIDTPWEVLERVLRALDGFDDIFSS